MSGAATNAILSYLAQSRDTVQAAIDDPAFCRAIRGIAEVTANALRSGCKLDSPVAPVQSQALAVVSARPNRLPPPTVLKIP
jgi:hypothetical protein